MNKLSIALAAVLACGFVPGAIAGSDAQASSPAAHSFVNVHAAAADDSGSRLVKEAVKLIDTVYAFGGVGAQGFDCSGFTQYVFEKALSLQLPRRAADQATLAGLRVVDRDGLRVGDLVFFNTRNHEFSHVGIYIGGDKFIHSPSSGKSVRIDNLADTYWTLRFTGARRA